MAKKLFTLRVRRPDMTSATRTLKLQFTNENDMHLVEQDMRRSGYVTDAEHTATVVYDGLRGRLEAMDTVQAFFKPLPDTEWRVCAIETSYDDAVHTAGIMTGDGHKTRIEQGTDGHWIVHRTV